MTLKKLGNRSLPSFSRNSDSLENDIVTPSWMKEFAKNLSKESVQPYQDQRYNVFDQISSIINSSKSKYSSVEDAVKDMQARSGLTAYQDKIKTLAQAIKTAGCSCDEEEHNHDDKEKVRLFEMKPQIKYTIDNFVNDTHGNLPIPSIIDRVKSIHKNDVSDDTAWNDDGLMHYINDKIIESKKQNPSQNDDAHTNLGKLPRYNEGDINPSNTDALFSLNPAVVK